MWVALLCFSGFLRPGHFAIIPEDGYADTTAGQLTAAESKGSVAWAEPNAFSSISPAEAPLQLFYKYYGLRLQWCMRYCPKPVFPVFGVTSLTEQFRILPNAP
ncbi:hypothetical protein GCM10011323_02620 [Pontibacter amylolyticus]|uniref:Uncharacterized protein n=1 Tax=Pontibacter amylolyticus TaxID=1424080 RepID=A0ABQ1VWL8_9BACT|nr:hypothetical protein GCM10011323_02620 [Pontibacter amylolyticus]